MENQEWGMDIVAGPLVTLSEAQRRIALEHDCIKSWRVSAQRKAAELKESSTRIATLEAALATQAEEHAKELAALRMELELEATTQGPALITYESNTTLLGKR